MLHNESIDEAREGNGVKPDSSQGSDSRGAQTPYVSPADVYAAYCERVDERKPWTPPPPLKGNTGR